MAEYIEREATCKDCVHYDICIFHHKGNENKECVHFKNKADVVEVRHGEWECPCFDISDFWRCSACGEEWFFEYDPTDAETKVNYCPNCGAKMDGKGEGE